jgi:F-type H+-transporting ATPase subunit gamma
MPSLKDFRLRIASVKNTRKITSAMKMVAASKLRQAQARAEQGRPYAAKMREALGRLIAAAGQRERTPLLDGTGNDKKILYVVFTADRGLCGGFNSNLLREARRHMLTQSVSGKEISVLTVGRKAKEGLRREYGASIIESLSLSVKYETAQAVTTKVMDMFNAGQFDIAYIAYSEFKNVIAQVPVVKQLVPFVLPETKQANQNDRAAYNTTPEGVYSFEPDAQTLLQRLIPQQIAAQVYSVILEVAAGEQAAKMTAMDNATRNAGDMISGLSLQYNRARQAYITKEVSEIVSGAEASA